MMRFDRQRRTPCAWRAGIVAMATAIVSLFGATLAQAAPSWDVQTQWAPNHLPPGGEGTFYVAIRNLGDSAADLTPTTVSVDLPLGVRLSSAGALGCVGATTVVCTLPDPIGNRTTEWQSGWGPKLFLPVEIDALASGTHPVTTTMAGGGSATVGIDSHAVTISSFPAGFGVVPDSFVNDVFDDEYPAGAPERQAGTHPFELRVNFDFKLKQPLTPEGRVKTVETTLPVGLIGNPEATPKCSASDFQSAGSVQPSTTGCPSETQVGTMELDLKQGPGTEFTGGFGGQTAVYNLEPPKGVPADFGFFVNGVAGHIYPGLDAGHDYAIKASVPLISDTAPVRSAQFTMWGVPGDPRHDKLRAQPGAGYFPQYGATFNAPIRPLLTLPSDCVGKSSGYGRWESWQAPGAFTPVMDSPELHVIGCDDPRFRFKPSVSLQPTSRSAGGPTGLAVDLLVPQRDGTAASAAELYDQSGDIQAIDTPPLKKAVVTMPEGMTISTSAAQGLGSCSTAQLSPGTNDPVTCPDSSQYGTLTLQTPMLPKDAPMTGTIYIAKQNDNPFNNFLSLYLVIQEPDRGLLVKIPAKVDLDPVTGQIKTTFDDLPQFPVSNMRLSLKGGVRAALVNPTTCGTKTITAEFFSWHEPDTPRVVSDHYEITQKGDGSPCVQSLGERAFKPQMSAGTVSSSAGSYSPFAFRTTRGDDDQEFSQLDVRLPKGLLANISGIAKCSDAAIAAADAPGRTGTEERDNPSCPASSQIGTTDVGSGVGQVITYIPGKVYLAGPYRGAPLSMVVITPILAGPYDLGVIAVRSKIEVNTDTTEASVSTDPFPQIFKGIPVRIRDIRVNVDRNRTIINPTSCNPMAVTARITGTGGDVNSTADDTAADLSSRFQASNCENLPFKPSLKFRLKGGTNRGDYPAFTATLRGRPGDANIARSVVTLPHSEFLAQEHIRTVCTRVQFAQEKCPEASIYGHAKAKSPLFDQTLEGPVYLRSSSNPLPDLVATLNGDIDVVLVGRIDSVKEQIRNTFDVVPDAPVSLFTLQMQGGKKGLLVNSRNLCKAPARGDVRMVGQNGKRYNSKPLVTNGCKKKARKGKKAKRAAKR